MKKECIYQKNYATMDIAESIQQHFSLYAKSSVFLIQSYGGNRIVCERILFWQETLRMQLERKDNEKRH